MRETPSDSSSAGLDLASGGDARSKDALRSEGVLRVFFFATTAC